MKIKHNSDYAAQRKNAYLPLEEQLDLMWHNPEAWRAHVEEVKARYPKPKA